MEVGHPATWVIATVTIVGLTGFWKKRAWGPALCACTSTAWAGHAFLTGQAAWGMIEAIYAAMNAGIAWRWSR